MKKIALITAVLAMSAISAEARNVTLKITNNMGNDITAFVVVPADGSAAPVNLVRPGGLVVGSSITEEILNVPDRCLYDFAVTYSTGIREDRKDVNICEQSEVILKQVP